VHVFCLGDGSQDLDNIPDLRKYVTSVTAAPVNALTIKLRALRRCSAENRSRCSLQRGEAACRDRWKFDELRLDLYRLQLQCGAIRRALSAGATDHASSATSTREMAAIRGAVEIPSKWIYAIEEKRLLAYERRIAHAFSYALVHTDLERRDFER